MYIICSYMYICRCRCLFARLSSTRHVVWCTPVSGRCAICICVCVCISIYIYISVFLLYVYICVYMYICRCRCFLAWLSGARDLVWRTPVSGR